MSKNLFSAVILFFALSGIAFGQYDPNEPLSREERERINKEFIALTQPELSILDYFLPEYKDSWTISIKSSGGIMGITRIVAAINSDGKYLCSNQKSKLLEAPQQNSFNKLFDLVRQTDFSLLKKNKKDLTFICNDCILTTVTYSFRPKKSRIKTFQFTSASYSFIDGDFKNLYEGILNTTDCQ